jgi:hypothetical protein
VKLAIMQPYLFPYIGYFQLMHAVDRFVVYDDVAFIKQGWINRNRILINGEAAYFSVPIRHASSFVTIRETLIDDDPQNARWVEKLLKTLDNAYRRAPEFARVFPLVESVFQRTTNRIADLAVASLESVADFLEIRIDWVKSSVAYGNDRLKGEDRVIAICGAEQANEYINVAGGRELYSPARFRAHGLALQFIRPKLVEYPQFTNPFVPSLSIIDVLMFNQRERVKELLDSYDLD